MSVPAWQPDRQLTPDTAATILTACFPGIDATGLRFLGSGWQFDAFLTVDGWVFRFPRRAAFAHLFDLEARVHDLVAPQLPAHISVPRVELVGSPMLGFPYRFAGHRFISGIPANTVAVDLLPTVARDIAAMLGALHSIPAHRARTAGIPETVVDDTGRQEWLEHGIAAARHLRGIDPAVDHALAWLRRTPPPTEPWDGPVQLIHQDLSTEHLLISPTTGRLVGVLDWTDAILGDAARDFVFLAAWRGWPFVEQVLRRYPRTVDSDFRSRLHSMARLLSTIWLALAHEQGKELTSHIQSVRNVFASAGAA